MSTIKVAISTIGRAGIGERIEFVTETKLKRGDIIELKPTKPSDAPIYGQAIVKKFLPTRRYLAVRIN